MVKIIAVVIVFTICRVPEMCGLGHFGVRVRPRLQILHPQESVDKRPHLHMSVNGVRATDVKYSSTDQW